MHEDNEYDASLDENEKNLWRANQSFPVLTHIHRQLIEDDGDDEDDIVHRISLSFNNQKHICRLLNVHFNDFISQITQALNS